MNSKLTKDMTVGSIVAEDFNRAQTLEQMGIDYCCHGSDTLQTACEKKGLNADDVLAKLDGKEVATGGAPDFANWPLDLLLDYVLKKLATGSASRLCAEEASPQLPPSPRSTHATRH